MLKQLLRDGTLYGLSLVVGRSAALLLLPLYTRALTPADYGTADVVLACIAIAHVVVGLEISQAQARYVPEADADERRAIASTALAFTAAAYAAAALALVAAAGWIGAWLGPAATPAMLAAALGTMIAHGLFRVVSGQLRHERRAAGFAAVSLLATLITVAVTVAAVVWAELGVTGLFLGHLAGGAGGLAVAGWLTRGSWGAGADRARLSRMLAYSTPLVASSLGVVLMLQVDRLALQQLATLTAVGVFGVAARLASIVQLVIAGFQTALSPMIYGTYREPGTPLALARLFAQFSAAALAVVLGLSLLAPELVAVLAAPAYAEAAGLLPILVPATLLGSMYVFAPGADIAQRTGLLAAINLAGGAVNAALTFALIPPLGVRGAALSSLTASALQFAGYLLLSQRFYPVPHRWGRLAAAALVAALAIGAGAGGSRAVRFALLAAGLATAPWIALSAQPRDPEGA